MAPGNCTSIYEPGRLSGHEATSLRSSHSLLLPSVVRFTDELLLLASAPMIYTQSCVLRPFKQVFHGTIQLPLRCYTLI